MHAVLRIARNSNLPGRAFAARRWMADNAAPMGAESDDRLKLLFCGRTMIDAFNFTREELDPAHFNVVCCNASDVASEVPTADMLVPLMSRIDSGLISRAPRLRCILQFGVGLEGVDIPAAKELGIRVANIPSEGTGNAASCAEMVPSCTPFPPRLLRALSDFPDNHIRPFSSSHSTYHHNNSNPMHRVSSSILKHSLAGLEQVLYLALSLLRDQRAMAAAVSDRQLGSPTGRLLLNSNALIIGWGAIARETATRLAALGVTVSALRRSPWPPPPASGPPGEHNTAQGAAAGGAAGHCAAEAVLAERGAQEDLGRMLALADVVVLACTLTAETTGMADDRFYAAMRPGAVLINIARGPLLDYGATLRALESGRLGGLGTDVAWREPIDPADPIAQHPRVVLTPHVGGVTVPSYKAMAAITAAEARALRAAMAAGGGGGASGGRPPLPPPGPRIRVFS